MSRQPPPPPPRRRTTNPPPPASESPEAHAPIQSSKNIDVFISYESNEKRYADVVLKVLEEHGIKCWIAPRDIPDGDSYAESITKAIRSCRVFVLVFTRYADDSPHVIREVERAVSVGAPIITFRIDHMVPGPAMEYFISSQQWVDAIGLRPGERDDDIHGRLVEAVNRKLRDKVSYVTRRARNLVARFAVGKLGCAVSISLLCLLLVAGPAIHFYSMPRDDTFAEEAPGEPESEWENREQVLAMLEDIKKKLAESDNYTQSAGGGGTGRSGRAARWVVNFDTESPQTYVKQLAQLGAEIAFPHEGDQWRYYADLIKAPRCEIRDLDDENRIYWMDERSFKGVADLLGESDAPFMVMFLPAELEEKLLHLELTYQGAEEDDILRTQFRVVSIGEMSDVIVADQDVR